MSSNRRRRRASDPPATPNRERLSTLRPRKRAGGPPLTRNHDRLSTLDDGVLHRILSYLPFDAAVRTCALSSRYCHVWCTNPSLVFPSFIDLETNILPDEYISAVDSALNLCNSIEHLTNLSFTIDEFGTMYDRIEIVSRWSDFAAVRLVDSLSFKCKYPVDDPELYREDEFYWLVPLPESFFCCWSILTLKLDHCAITRIPNELGRPIFPFLETIFLSSVAFTEDSFSGFLSASPKIRKLNIAGTKITEHIVISSATMETLDVYNNVFHVRGPVSINFAPELRFLGLCCDLTMVECVHLDKLEEAVLLSGAVKKFNERNEWRSLISSVENVKELVVDDWFTEFTLNEDIDFCYRSPIFKNLIKLGFCDNPSGLDWIRGLLHNISECPILEELYIRLECKWSRRDVNSSFFDDIDSDNDESVSDEQIQKKNNEDRENILGELKKNIKLIPPIKTIKIEGYSQEPAVTTLIEFFLHKSSFLKFVIIYYHKDYLKSSEEIIEKMRAINIKKNINVQIITRDWSDFNESKFRHDVCWNPILCD